MKNYDDAFGQLLNERVIKELTGTIPGFDRAGMLAALFGAWGGVDRFARDLYHEYQAAAPGSMTRQRLMDLVCRLLSQHTEDVKVRPAEDLDDEELKKAVFDLINRRHDDGA